MLSPLSFSIIMKLLETKDDIAVLFIIAVAVLLFFVLRLSWCRNIAGIDQNAFGGFQFLFQLAPIYGVPLGMMRIDCIQGLHTHIGIRFVTPLRSDDPDVAAQECIIGSRARDVKIKVYGVHLPGAVGVSGRHGIVTINNSNQFCYTDIGRTASTVNLGTEAETELEFGEEHLLRNNERIQIGDDTILKFTFTAP